MTTPPGQVRPSVRTAPRARSARRIAAVQRPGRSNPRCQHGADGESRQKISRQTTCLANAARKPYVPQQPGYNKRLRAARGLIQHCIAVLARSASLWTNDVWVADSTPVECGRSRETTRRSDLAGWAEYGYCASHSRYFWGLRLHLLCTLHGLPVGYALAGAKADERHVLLGILDDRDLASQRGQVIIADKGYYGRDFEAALTAAGFRLLRPARKGEPQPAGRQYFKPLRQVIESVNDTLKGQLDLERHGGRTVEGVTVRVLQRILALTTAIWHNDATGQQIKRSLIAYDH